jgi:hypothetical protein
MAICVGICVDFTCHHAHAYNHATSSSGRQGRVTHSLTEMGISVVSAAATTFTAACVLMFFTTVTFFSKFGVFLAICMVCSVQELLSNISQDRAPMTARTEYTMKTFRFINLRCLFVEIDQVLVALIFFHALLAMVGPSNMEGEISAQEALRQAFTDCAGACRRRSRGVGPGVGGEGSFGEGSFGITGSSESPLRFSTEDQVM